MKRQAFINWERVTESNKPENKRRYIVAEIMDMGEDVAALKFATWYEKGTILEVPTKPEKDIRDMNSRERLLNAIFGSYKEYEIPESGFYIMTSDYGIDETSEGGAFAGCTQMLIKLSDDIFFADEPLVPNGYLTERQYDEQMKAKSKRIRETMDEEAINDVKDEMEKNEYVKEVITHMTEKVDVSASDEKKKAYNFGVYELSSLSIAKCIVDAERSIEALMQLMKDEGDSESLAMTLKEANSSNTYKECLNEIMNHDSLKDVSPRVRRCILIYLECLMTEGNFYYYRDKFASQYDNPMQVMIGANATRNIAIRLERSYKLREMGAPAVIQINELRMLSINIIELSRINDLIDVTDKFESEFGIHKDGSKFEGESEFGDYESQTKHYEDEDDGSVEDRFFIVHSPNYAYKMGKYSLWNPKRKIYYRENGQVVVFLEWKAARDKREELNE